MWPEQDRDWARAYAQAMLLAGAAESGVAAALSDSLAAVQASGERPGELFGSAGAYGRACGRGLIPAADRLERDLTFSSLPLLGAAMLLSVGGVVALLGVFIGLSDGWTAEVFQGKITLLFPLIGALLAVFIWGWTVRTRGHLRQAALLWIAASVLMVSLPGIMMALPEMSFLRLPGWALVIFGAVLLGVAALLPKIKSRRLVADSQWDSERWFAHAQALLRGRYLFSRAQAQAAVREARTHLELAGEVAGTPAQEFGNVEIFVARLGAAEHTSAQRTVLLKRVGFLLAAAVLFTLAVTGVMQDGNWWMGAYGAIVGAWCLSRGLSKKSGRAALRLQRRRRADVVAMADDLHD